MALSSARNSRFLRLEVLDRISNRSNLEEASSSAAAFEKLYLALRQKEQRVYSDEELKALPEVPKSHRYAKEWQIRKQSYQKLAAHLTKKKKPLKILEVGCGNAWLAAKLAELSNTTVYGIDTSLEELNQARNVFKKSNLNLEKLDFEMEDLADLKFDVIVFAASIQYFQSIKNILNKAQHHLEKDGEIHVLDTNFYSFSAIADAKKRSYDYLLKLGFPELASFYFQHQLDDLKSFNYKIIYRPTSIFNKWFVKNPFYWICIKSNR